MSVGIQYIICECGDNFPNEKLLNIHLANDHADVEIFQCPHCPEILPNAELYERHINEHNEQKKEKTQNTKTDPSTVVKKNPKLPPVIKVQNLKRIDTISLLQGLKVYSGLLKGQNRTEASSQQSVKVEAVLETVNVTVPETVKETAPETVKETALVNIKNETEENATLQYEEDEEIYYQCDVCNIIFYTEQDFNVHYQSTHAMKTEVTAEDILEDHLVSDHIDSVSVKTEEEEEEAYYYECEVCHKIFASEQFFNRHYNKVHADLLPAEHNDEEILPDMRTEEESQQPSESQDYSIEAYKNVEEQIRDTAAEQTQPKEVTISPKAPEQVIYYKCDLCKILYPSEKAYNSHFNKKHGGGQTGFQFIEQDLSLPYTQPIPKQEEFCCEFCPKVFNMKRSLQVHRKRVHGDRLPPSAPRAPKAPNRSKVCDVCGRAYNSNAALRYHQRRHTGEKPYPCTMCPKRFTMPMFLQIHLRTHTGEKPYECNLCPKAFTNKAALIRHDRVHTGIKPYPCPECGKYFTQSNSMKLHVSTVHLKLPAPYKSKNRRNKSEARALQLALKSLPSEIIVEEDVIDD